MKWIPLVFYAPRWKIVMSSYRIDLIKTDDIVRSNLILSNLIKYEGAFGRPVDFSGF